MNTNKRDDICSILALVLVVFLFALCLHLESVLSYETKKDETTHTASVKCAETCVKRVATHEVCEETPEYISLGNFETTGYCPCEKCCGKWADGYTATNTVATEDVTCAVDPEIIPYGTKLMLLFDDGRIEHYTAEDCGGAIKGNRIDVFYNNHSTALAHGVQNASVYIETN